MFGRVHVSHSTYHSPGPLSALLFSCALPAAAEAKLEVNGEGIVRTTDRDEEAQGWVTTGAS